MPKLNNVTGHRQIYERQMSIKQMSLKGTPTSDRLNEKWLDFTLFILF